MTLKNYFMRTNVASLFLLALVFSGCGLTTPAPVYPTVNKSQSLGGGISGEFKSVDGRVVNMTDSQNKIQILMFVSETCSVCRHETQGLVADLATRGTPKNVSFYSIVVGSELADASDWKSSLKATWDVGIQDGDTSFRADCPEGKTPCVLLTNPENSTTTKLIGEHSVSEWEQITGNWSY